MYQIVFYKDEHGKSSIMEELERLRSKKDKNSRINLTKTEDIINKLKIYGLSLGMPYIRKINDEIWEMRPLKNRILFFFYRNEEFVLLSSFIKKTNKTPKKEIDKAIYRMNYYIEWKESKNEQNKIKL